MQEIKNIIEKEAKSEDNKYVDSFVVIVYGTPANFEFGYIPEVLNNQNAPRLVGKPKLLYVIGISTMMIPFLLPSTTGFEINNSLAYINYITMQKQ